MGARGLAASHILCLQSSLQLVVFLLVILAFRSGYQSTSRICRSFQCRIYFLQRYYPCASQLSLLILSLSLITMRREVKSEGCGWRNEEPPLDALAASLTLSHTISSLFFSVAHSFAAFAVSAPWQKHSIGRFSDTLTIPSSAYFLVRLNQYVFVWCDVVSIHEQNPKPGSYLE